MKKFLLAIIILLVLIFCCGICFATYYLFSQASNLFNQKASQVTFEYESGDIYSLNKILLLKINGTILDTRDDIPSVFTAGYIFGYEIKDSLYQAAADDDIKGIIIEINSGGGTVLGSRAIVDGINYYKEVTGKPVYGYIRGFAASGAYMVASACDYLVADYGSLTGSIGVIFGTPFKYYNSVTSEGSSSGDYVVTEKGIQTFYISSGEYKDIGNPYRLMTQEELESLQSNIDTEYDLFVDLVSLNRGISEYIIKNDIKALIYGNTQALDLDLIDAEATYEEVIDSIKTKIGISEYQIVTIEVDDLWSMLLSSLAPNTDIKSSPLQNRILLLYGDSSMYD